MQTNLSDDSIIIRVVQQLSSLKYFYNWSVVTLVKDYKLDEKREKRVLKKLTRTLERLGYRNHKGGEQTVRIVRTL